MEVLPVMEVQHKACANGAWIVEFTQEGQDKLPDESASATVKNAFWLQSGRAYSLIALNVVKDLQVHSSLVTEPLVAWRTAKAILVCISHTDFCSHQRDSKTYARQDQRNVEVTL